MMNVKWDIKDIMSQHSSYVDSLLHVSLMSTHVCLNVPTRVIADYLVLNQGFHTCWSHMGYGLWGYNVP